ncbi:MAG: carboxypeptidase M32 [Candidatus Bathyarchaeia archaeon]
MSTDIHSAYKRLLTKTRDLIVLQSIEELVRWDMETMMPPKAVEQRSLQLALLSRLKHKMSTAKEIGKLLNTIINHPKYEALSSIEKRNVYLIKKEYDEQTALPEQLVAEIARQQAITVNAWKKAKAKQNYALLESELEKLVSLNRTAAKILMKTKETATPYDALLDIFEPKTTTTLLNAVFSDLQEGLTALMERIQKAPNQPDTHLLNITVPVEIQRQIAAILAGVLGYDIASPNAAGRIDETEHPFTSGYYDDVRITTHYYLDNFTSSIFSVLHEAGHALYEQGLPQEWKYQPVGAPCSYGIHESQSRFIENVIGRSKEFWNYVLPQIKKLTPALSNITLDSFVHAINRVQPSKIRVEADEVTYCIHIIIRFQIESNLFADKVQVNELPEIWNQKYKQLLGLTIKNDSEGIMQDTHWASGLYGYFPSYALGNIYSGQMLAQISSDLPNWQNELAHGNMNNLRLWLTENIYRQGNLYDPAVLIKKITGKTLDAKPYLQYLEKKYTTLYGF